MLYALRLMQTMDAWLPVLYHLLEAISVATSDSHTADPHLPSAALGKTEGPGASLNLTAREKLLLRSGQRKSRSGAANPHASEAPALASTTNQYHHHASYLHTQMVHAACARALDQVARQGLAPPPHSLNIFITPILLIDINTFPPNPPTTLPSRTALLHCRPWRCVRRLSEGAWQDTPSPPFQWGIIYTATARQGGPL